MSTDIINAELGRVLNEIRTTLLGEFTKMAAPEGTFDERSTHSMLVEYIDICRKYRDEAKPKQYFTNDEVKVRVSDMHEFMDSYLRSLGVDYPTTGIFMKAERVKEVLEEHVSQAENRAREEAICLDSTLRTLGVDDIPESVPDKWQKVSHVTRQIMADVNGDLPKTKPYLNDLEHFLGIHKISVTTEGRKDDIVQATRELVMATMSPTNSQRVVELKDILNRVLVVVGGVPDPNETVRDLGKRTLDMVKKTLGVDAT
ncbi:gp100 [Rhodococcus phage ReqiPoco6]|uniref:Gp100 n=1 Tax=Rhodococcus phage ReqiPoco6 TaxID=691964 RepID=D4P7W8_9CAUD|nr:gp100 [Rhodococcus phage ReqiPoco6]ADD81098.1 gp100 [Rhodococcus phage ReqiPoco6]